MESTDAMMITHIRRTFAKVCPLIDEELPETLARDIWDEWLAGHWREALCDPLPETLNGWWLYCWLPEIMGVPTKVEWDEFFSRHDGWLDGYAPPEED
jgi:hypothetical protein